MKNRSIVLVVSLLVLSQALFGQAWSESDAKLTVGEFLQQRFEMGERTEGGNSFNSWSIVSFYPGSSVDTAIVLVLQTYNMIGRAAGSQTTRREIEAVAASLVNNFVAKCHSQIIRKRWTPKDPVTRFIVKHVRANDINEVIAVTIDGKTYFEDERTLEAEARVAISGGFWNY